MDEQGLFDVMIDSAILLDKSGKVVNWNAGATSLFGYPKKEMVGKSVNTIYDKNYPFPKLIQELQESNKRWHEDTNFINKDGKKGHCLSYLCPLPVKDDSKISAILVHQNITPYKAIETDLEKSSKRIEQLLGLLGDYWGSNVLLIQTLNTLEQTERRLRESELRFHLLAENAKDVISRHAPDGTYLYISPSCKPVMGYEPENLLGKYIYKFIHKDDHGKLKKALAKRRENQKSKPILYRIKRKEGEFRWFESNIRLIVDEQTNIISEIQLASRDVTDMVLDKKARIKGQQLAQVFRLSTMEEMASGMAHEISQPLAAIVNYTRGCVRFLESDNYDKDKLKSAIEKAAAQAERAGEIIQRLKNFFCKGQLTKTRCKVNNVIRETISLMRTELMASKTKIETTYDKSIPSAYMDKIQMQQVTLNLITNAIEAMQQNHIKDKRIQIQTKLINSKKIEVTFQDSGLGFSKEIASKVFTPFFTTKTHGRGMGLAICRSIIEAHGGELTINPKKNANSKSWIRFTLPTSI